MYVLCVIAENSLDEVEAAVDDRCADSDEDSDLLISTVSVSHVVAF